MRLPRLPFRPQVVSIDAGNTFLNIRFEALAEIIERHGGRGPGGRVDADQLRRGEWRARKSLDERLARGRRDVVGSTGPNALFRAYLSRLLDEAGVVLAPADRRLAFAGIVEYHAEHNLWSEPHPHARRVFAELRAAGLRIVVVSNSDGRLRTQLAQLGLARLFDRVVDSAEVGFEKPDPRIFACALEGIGVAAGRAIHVGDLVWADVAGARAAGLHPVLLDPANLWGRLDCDRIADLAALPQLVRGATASRC